MGRLVWYYGVMMTVLLVPGFREDIATRNYTCLINAIEAGGYTVRFVPIIWKQTTIEQWITELDAIYAQYDPKQTILAGFSYGAMTAFVSAARRNPYELWLFSLSPYFAEDLTSKHMKTSWLKKIGHRRVSAFAKLNFEFLAKSIHCKTYLFMGQKEIDKWPIMNQRLNAANALVPNSTKVIAKGVGHDVTNVNYIQSIVKAIA